MSARFGKAGAGRRCGPQTQSFAVCGHYRQHSSAYKCHAAGAASAQSNGAAPQQEGPVVVWYKHDLRTTDHPGLAAAIATGRSVVCFFGFDPAAFADQLTHLWGPAVVLGAVADLRRRLQQLNCPLVVRSGDSAQELARVVKDLGAGEVVYHAEVEQHWLQVQQAAEQALPDDIKQVQWRAPLWDTTKYAQPNFNAFRRARSHPHASRAAPQPQAAAPELRVDEGSIPGADSWRAQLESISAQRFPAGGLPQHGQQGVPFHEPDATFRNEKGWVYRELEDVVTGGESAYLDALQQYVNGGKEAEARPLRNVVRQLEAVPGNEQGSFTSIFQPAVSLGILSRRHIYTVALEREKSRVGFAWAFQSESSSRDAKAAAAVAECGDYHTGIAHLLHERPTQAADAKRHFWRWNGQMVDYLVAEPSDPSKANGETILLVHGFGAFAEHWRRNVPELATRGYRVFACTLPGFGPSEKSPQAYTTALWKAYVRDFVVNVAHTPVTIAGNSIGGVIPANACADHPQLFKGIVLINTAGSTDTAYDVNAVIEEKKRSKVFVSGASWLTFQYLQRGIANTLRKVYPVRPDNADKFLNDEIYRASCDPCALQVLRSGFYLSSQRPLPYLLNELYQGPVLILQGVLDPLNNAEERANTLERVLSNSQKVLIQAGHCPHDEVPELVNDAIAEFVESITGCAKGVGASDNAAVAQQPVLA